MDSGMNEEKILGTGEALYSAVREWKIRHSSCSHRNGPMMVSMAPETYHELLAEFRRSRIASVSFSPFDNKVFGMQIRLDPTIAEKEFTFHWREMP